MDLEAEALCVPYVSSSKPLNPVQSQTNEFTIGPSLPDYLDSDCKDPIRQWKIKHESEMFNKLITSQKTLRENQHSNKLEIIKLLRKVPIDLITREFLNKDKLTIDARAYIIDKIIPVVVLGLEKLLIEADKRGLISKDFDPNFNPINFLAQYLMRNNPAFSNFNEASPYVRGLRQVVNELKVEIFHLSDNKLARVKASAKAKRIERDKEEGRKKLEAKRRIEIYQKLFDQFLIHNQTKVDYDTVHLSIKSFSEIVQKFPEEMKAKLTPIIKMIYTEAKDKKLGRKDFGLLISHYADDMPLDIFNQFADHLSKCAKLYRSSMEKEARRKLLSNLFITCDMEEMGLLDRQRIIMLFDEFFTKVPENIRAMLRNPKHWPITDYNQKSYQDTAEETQPENIDVAENVNETANEKDNMQNVNNEWAYEENLNNNVGDELMEDLSNNQEETQDIPDNIGHGDVGLEDKDSLIELVKNNQEKLNENVSISRQDSRENVEMENVEKFDDVSLARHESKDSEKLEKVTENLQSGKGRRVTIEEGLNKTLDDLENIESQTSSVIEEDDYDESQPIEYKLERESSKLSATTRSSAYDEENINFPQFFQVTEEFLGDEPSLMVLEDLIEFIREGYQETPEERLKRLQKARRQVLSAQRKQLINELFNTWDESNTGSVDMNEIADMLKKYKNGILNQGIKAAKKETRMAQVRRKKILTLNIKEFRIFMETIIKNTELMKNEGETETMISYFISLVQRTYAEKLRGEARRKWLNMILWAGEVSCGLIDGLFRTVFQVLYKDAEQHGNGKKIGSNIALLEENKFNPELKGQYLLHFVVSTPDQSDYVVGKILDGKTPNLYFQTIQSGNITYIPNCSENSKVIYWNPSITNEAKEGALSIIPIKDDLNRVFGVISIDTFNDSNPSETIFDNHEMLFYQGVSKEFNTAFCNVEMLKRIIIVSKSAIAWICRRIDSIKGVDFYIREKRYQKSTDDFVLRFVLSANGRGELTEKPKYPKMEKNDNLFKNYLFETVETSQSVTREAYGERHISIPLRDLNGLAITVIDMNIGEIKFLPTVENNEITRMMCLLQKGLTEIIKMSQIMADETTDAGNMENNQVINPRVELRAASLGANAETIFHELMLIDLRANVSKLDYQAYAELRSYKDPPITVHAIIQALLTLVYPKEADSGLFQNWEKCKKYISINLAKLILAFDPFGDISNIPFNVISEAMTKIPNSEVDKHSSKPALDLFNWVFCCFMLIEHRIKTEAEIGHKIM